MIDHATGKVLAYVLAPHTDAALQSLMQLLQPFGIERKHLTLRTRIKRLARKTICFSKSGWLHDIAIGLFVNRYEFGLAV